MSFEFATAGRILFGPGAASRLPELARELGARALLVAGQPRGGAADLVERLGAAGALAARLAIRAEPTIGDASEGARLATAASCDLVIAIGGGSVIDAAKAIGALAANPGDPLRYMEVVGEGRPLARPSLPVIAVPTTAGTGAEVTKNAVLASPAHRVKASLRSPFMLPRVALVDPRLTVDLPPAVTASTGLDALTQVIEPYLSPRANPMTDAFCREGMVLASASLRDAFADGTREDARERMSLASLFGGLALANAGLGAVHGFAGPLGGRFAAPHGALCAALLPAVMRVNLAAVRARHHDDRPLLARFDQVARLLTGHREAPAEEGIDWLRALVRELGIPPLRAYGVGEEHLPDLLAQARASSSMKGNPVELTDEELARIVKESL